MADGSGVYSEGVRSVCFNPAMEGHEMAPLEFTNVLYVPALHSNLFSVLYLALHCHFIISIENTVHFIRDNKIAFQVKTGALTADPFEFISIHHDEVPL